MYLVSIHLFIFRRNKLLPKCPPQQRVRIRIARVINSRVATLVSSVVSLKMMTGRGALRCVTVAIVILSLASLAASLRGKAPSNNKPFGTPHGAEPFHTSGQPRRFDQSDARAADASGKRGHVTSKEKKAKASKASRPQLKGKGGGGGGGGGTSQAARVVSTANHGGGDDETR
jgi:hypothetical protein